MRVSPPQFVCVVVDGESVRPAKPRVDHHRSHAAVHASATNARCEAPVSPEQISDTTMKNSRLQDRTSCSHSRYRRRHTSQRPITHRTYGTIKTRCFQAKRTLSSWKQVEIKNRDTEP